MCGLGNIHTSLPPHGRSLEILRGRKVCEARLVLGKYGDKPEFPKRWGL